MADRLLGRALESGQDASALGVGLAPREPGAGKVGLGLRCRERAVGDPEPKRRLFLEPRIAEEPAVLLEEADHGSRLLHRCDVLRELGAEVGRRAGLGRRRCGAEHEGAQARD